MQQRRGSISLFANIFDTPEIEKPLNVQESFRLRKIDCIIDYFYFHGQMPTGIVKGREIRMQYDDLIQLVSDCFFLSPRTISDILQEHRDKLMAVRKLHKEAKKEQLLKAMKEKWPHLAWAA